MKINLSICRIASLLAVVLVFGVGCAMGRPSITWKKPIPVQKAPLVPAGYKLVPDTAPATALTPSSTNTPVVLNPPVVGQGTAPTNGLAIIKAPGILTEDRPISSGNPPFEVNFSNPFDFPLTVVINHKHDQKIEVPKRGSKKARIDSGNLVAVYEVLVNGQVAYVGEVKTTIGIPYASVVLSLPVTRSP
ncbi:MAG: hypothetical protein AAB447_03240 [Patescibacteria group bacterium]